MRDRMSPILRTSGNGCFQSPSFQDHVNKKRRALETRMSSNWQQRSHMLNLFILWRLLHLREWEEWRWVNLREIFIATREVARRQKAHTLLNTASRRLSFNQMWWSSKTARSVLKNFLNTQFIASRFKGIEIWKPPPRVLKSLKRLYFGSLIRNSQLTPDTQKLSNVPSMHQKFSNFWSLKEFCT